ncbi:hypothetical protein ACFSCX_06830 [Bacillus salitolerans]|uniref:PXO1-76 n=1 Tax=Bacillus salitolerans TaxID=1437434 RepID=A0ABW4LMB0_9BACI
MRDVLILGVLAIGLYVFARMMLKEPILPWKEKKSTGSNNVSFKKFKKKQNNIDNLEIDVVKNFFHDVETITHHMLRLHNNRFVLMAEVTPVNYFLLSQDEQEAIDIEFEKWLAQINYDVIPYLTNRFIDLSEAIENMKKEMYSQDDLSSNALEYGKSFISDLEYWQQSNPRFETKRFILIPYQVSLEGIEADDKEELEERILDKAFSELYRRFNTARSALSKGKMYVELLTNEGIVETFYYALNRRKAVKNKFKDIALREQLSLFVTADQDPTRIEAIKEAIDLEFTQSEKENDVESSEETTEKAS